MTPAAQQFDCPQINSCNDCGPFFMDVSGRFAQSDIVVKWNDAPRPTNPQVEQTINTAWQNSLARSQESGGIIYDGALCRVVDFSVGEGKLNMTLGPCSYREFLGTNLMNPSLRYTYGPEILANALGVSAAVLSADGFLVFGKRSSRVTFYSGKIHPIGGMAEPSADDNQSSDLFAAITSELTEETALPQATIKDMLCLGMVRDKQIVQPELIFDITVDAAATDIRTVSGKAADAAEHSEWVMVRNAPTAVVSFMENNFSQLTPVALATLLLHGLRCWGGGWFATVRGYLKKVI